MQYSGELSIETGLGTFPLAYTETMGDPQKTPILYVHGWGCSKEDFDTASLEPLLADRRLVAFDFPGCGESPCATTGMSEYTMIRLTGAVAQALEVGRAVIVGHGYGGAIAAEFAHHYWFPPVKGVVSVMGSMQGQVDWFLAGKVAAMSSSAFVNGGFGHMVSEWAASDNPGMQRYAAGLSTYSHEQIAAYHAYAKTMVDHTIYGRVFDKFIAGRWPKLFVHGQAEQAVYLDELATAGVPIATIENAGHFPFVDNPADYYRAIGTFVAKLDTEQS